MRLARVLSAAAAIAISATCGRPTSPEGHVQTLRVGYQASSEVTSVLADMLFADTLVSIDWRGRPALQLASEYRWSEDGKALQITLRKGVTFHDGTPLTSGAVAASIRQYSRTHSGSLEFVAGVEEIDPGTILIHLKQPDAFLLEEIASVPILDPQNRNNATGPFKPVSREPVIEAQRNGQYYRGTPGIERVRITTYDTPRAAWAAMMRGEVDMVPEVNRDSVEFLEGVSRFETYSSVRPFYIPLVFNLRHPVLKNLEVRRALAEAIDREEIVRQAMRGHGKVADDPIWPFHWAYVTAARARGFNPGAAAMRLTDAGFPLRASATAAAMPSRFRIRCLFWDKGPQYERIALLLQRQLAAVGVDLVLERADEETVQRRAASGEFDTFLLQMASGKSFDWTYTFWHSPSPGSRWRQNSGYSGVDEILERMRQTRADADIRVAVADLRQRFQEDVPAAFIAWLEVTRAVDAHFDVGDPSDPEILANLWRWKVGAAQRASR